jgi:hypothetical protein
MATSQGRLIPTQTEKMIQEAFEVFEENDQCDGK